MPNLIDINDFIAEFSLSTDQYEEENLYNFIQKNQESYIYDLLGAELGTLFINDINPNPPYEPQTPIYQTIYEPFVEDIEFSNVIFDWDCFAYCHTWVDHFCHNKRYYESRGIKYYLKSMIYFDYVRQFVGEAGIQTLVQRENTNSSNTQMIGNFMTNKYNKGVETGKAIQWYIRENKDDYEQFNGSKLEYNLPI